MSNDKKHEMKVDNGAYGTEYVKVDFPANSHKVREEQVEKKKVEKIVKGKVHVRKKPIMKRMLETFVKEDVDNVSSYIKEDILVPAFKNTIKDTFATIFDALQGSIEVSLFGERISSINRRRNGKGTYVSYDNFSKRDGRREVSATDRARFNFDDIGFESKGEAKDVLDRLVDLIIDYDEATVADFYDFVGIRSDHTDTRYGWKDLSRTEVLRVRDGYMIDLPRPRLLD